MSSIFLQIGRSVQEGKKNHNSERIRTLSEHLSYPHLLESQKLFHVDDQHVFYLSSNNPGILVHEMNVCCGLLPNKADNWWLKDMPPSASFMVTTDNTHCVLQANKVASRLDSLR